MVIMTTLSAIPIKPQWIKLILEGTKTWEIRTKKTNKIGPVALIQSGSGTVVAYANISEVIKLTETLARENAHKMGMEPDVAVSWSTNSYAYVLKDVVVLKNPVPYIHPLGAVTWVTLDEPTSTKVLEESRRSQV
jgi:hypothetical protein